MTFAVVQQADGVGSSGTCATGTGGTDFSASLTTGNNLLVFCSCLGQNVAPSVSFTSSGTAVLGTPVRIGATTDYASSFNGQLVYQIPITTGGTISALTGTVSNMPTIQGIVAWETTPLTFISGETNSAGDVGTGGGGTDSLSTGNVPPTGTLTNSNGILFGFGYMAQNYNGAGAGSNGTGFTALGAQFWKDTVNNVEQGTAEYKQLTSGTPTPATFTPPVFINAWVIGVVGYVAGGAPPTTVYNEEWDYSSDEYVAAEETTAVILRVFDSAPVYRVDPHQYDDIYYYVVGDDYDEPIVSDNEWSTPIQPNAPSLVTQFFGDVAEVLDEETAPNYNSDGYIQFDATPNGPEDIWSWEETIDDELVLFNEYSSQPAPPPSNAPFQYFGDDAERLIEDELSQRFVDGYLQSDSSSPTSGAPLNEEYVAATLEEEAEDFFADHFTNYDNDQTFYDEQWSWEDAFDDEWHLEQFNPVGPDATKTPPPEDQYWILDEHVEDDYYFDEYASVSVIAPPAIFNHDDWDWSELIDDDWLANDTDSVVVPTAVYYGDDAELLDENTHDEYTPDENVGLSYVPPAPANGAEDAWDFAYDDIEDQWEIDELVGVSFVVPPAPPAEDAWQVVFDDIDDELVNDDPIGKNADVLIVEDAWDFAYDDIDDEWWIEETPIVNTAPVVQDEWDFAHDDIEDQWEVDEVQSINLPPVPALVEDGWSFEFDVIEDESFWHDEQIGANAIPKVSYYGEDAELLDEEFDDEHAQHVDVDPVGPDYQALIVDDGGWEYHEELDDDWYNWPSESTAPNPTPFIDYGDDLLHFFDELYSVDDDVDWFASPLYVVEPARVWLYVSRVTTILKVRR